MCVRNSESVANKRISIYQTRKISKEGKEEERDREKKNNKYPGVSFGNWRNTTPET